MPGAELSRETGATRAEGPLATLCRHAAGLGWRCLSVAWDGYHTNYSFECGNGHRFEKHGSTVLYGKAAGCAACRRDALRERWLAEVAARGGEIVSGPFTVLTARYRLRCADGHEWETPGSRISEGHWCPVCARAALTQHNCRGDGLARLQAAAVAHGGRCLAAEYTIGSRYYPFECALGHRWETRGHEVIRRSWCPVCARAASTQANIDPEGLARLQRAAQERGGRCLTTGYTSQAAKYRFRCAAGHEWQNTGQNVLNGNWCHRCGVDARRLTIGQMQELAAARGGVCLSERYVNKDAKLTWQCHRGHVWQASTSSVRNGGHWCPSCAILDTVRAKNSWKRSRYEAPGEGMTARPRSRSEPGNGD